MEVLKDNASYSYDVFLESEIQNSKLHPSFFDGLFRESGGFLTLS